MGQAKDQDVDEPRVQEPAGKVEVDSRGNSVWRWARDVLESTSVLLKRLENKDLALEPTQKVPVVGGADAAQKRHKAHRGAAATDEDDEAPAPHPGARRQGGRDGGGGFDPYNSR